MLASAITELIDTVPSFVISLSILIYIPVEFFTFFKLISFKFFTLFLSKFTSTTVESSISAIPTALFAASEPFFSKFILPAFSYLAFAADLAAIFIPIEFSP